MSKRLGAASLLSMALTLLMIVPAGASKESRAANLLTHYYNVYMVNEFNQGVKEQNSSNPPTTEAGIKLEIKAINSFNSKLGSIHYPSSDKEALNKVLNSDSVLASLDGTLAINTENVSNYNSLFPGVETAQANSTAAIAALAHKLGLAWK